MFGWTGKILRVDLSARSVRLEPLDAKAAREFIGARGLGSWYLSREVDPGVDPLSPANKLLFFTGPLTGTAAPSGGRYHVITKSPLTGAIAASNSGGHWGPELKYAGYDGIIVEGRADHPVYIWIADGRVEIRSASHLWGHDVAETTDMLLAQTDPRARVACIGPAGENQVLFASVLNDYNRAAGRSGVGAVMGSKNLKAVVVRGTGAVAVADPSGFAAVSQRDRSTLEAAAVTGQGLPNLGTMILMNVMNEVGGLPIRNFRDSGTWAGAEEISGEALRERYVIRAKGCFGCNIHCGRVSRTDGPYADQGDGPEFEAAWALGASCGVNDLAAVSKAAFLCNKLGMDPITMGATIACAMELCEDGYLSAEQAGMDLRFGDADAVVALTRQTAMRAGFGQYLADGSYRLATRFGHPEYSMSVKKQEMPAYDPRAVQGMGLTYATSNRGGCHVRGYTVSDEVLGIPAKVEMQAAKGKPALTMWRQDLTAAVDSAGLCLFVTFALGAEQVADQLRAATGAEMSVADLFKAGERIYNLERLFNLGAGLTAADDVLPQRLLNEPLRFGPQAGNRSRLGAMLPEYYMVRGWDADGRPTPAKLAELGLEVPVPVRPAGQPEEEGEVEL